MSLLLPVSSSSSHVVSLTLDQSPSMWTLSNIVPAHSKLTLEQYRFGLGCNSMEGRELKHQQIYRYSQNTTYQCRWPAIFRHEYMQLIHLRENGYGITKYRRKIISYLPEMSDNCCLSCGLVFKMQTVVYRIFMTQLCISYNFPQISRNIGIYCCIISVRKKKLITLQYSVNFCDQVFLSIYNVL